LKDQDNGPVKGRLDSSRRKNGSGFDSNKKKEASGGDPHPRVKMTRESRHGKVIKGTISKKDWW